MINGVQIETANPCMITIEVFEGPLDLLLYLIKKHELDIFDIPISFITDRYLEYLATMQELQLDIAAQYLEMAATLAQIKSQMLLPDEQTEEIEESKDEKDPREELIKRLLEYKKYKEAGRELLKFSIVGKDTFTGPGHTEQTETTIATDVSIFDLVAIAGKLIEDARKRCSSQDELLADRITVAERISEITSILEERKNLKFSMLLGKDFTVAEVVVTFLAILEMVRLRLISVRQNPDGEDIYIEKPVPLEKIKSPRQKKEKIKPFHEKKPSDDPQKLQAPDKSDEEKEEKSKSEKKARGKSHRQIDEAKPETTDQKEEIIKGLAEIFNGNSRQQG